MSQKYRVYRVPFDPYRESGFGILSWNSDGIETAVEFFLLDADGNLLCARRERGRHETLSNTPVGEIEIDTTSWVGRTTESMRTEAQRLRDEACRDRYGGVTGFEPITLAEADPITLMRVRMGDHAGNGLETVAKESSDPAMRKLAQGLLGIRRVPTHEDL